MLYQTETMECHPLYLGYSKAFRKGNSSSYMSRMKNSNLPEQSGIISDSRNRLRVQVEYISPVKPVSRQGAWRIRNVEFREKTRPE